MVYNGLITRIPNYGPILGDHRIYVGNQGRQGPTSAGLWGCAWGHYSASGVTAPPEATNLKHQSWNQELATPWLAK